MTNQKIKEDGYKLNIGSPEVQLFKLEIAEEDPIYFTNGVIGGSPVSFGGVEYSPFPVEVEGFEITGDGKMPRPILRLSNITHAFVALVATYNGLVGSKLTRRRTFEKYLDGQPEADSDAQYPIDVYYISRRVIQNKYLIEWELISTLDAENLFIPKRQCLSYCRYKYGIGEDWAECPYDGSNGYFNAEGVSEPLIADDKCGKKLFDCRLRFPDTDEEIPFYGFPGIGAFGHPYR
jgi:lambda family phage minor tail protein L